MILLCDRIHKMQRHSLVVVKLRGPLWNVNLPVEVKAEVEQLKVQPMKPTFNGLEFI